MIKIPPYLKKGDTIAITCPAGYMAKEKAATCISVLQSWGYEVMLGKTLGSSSKNYFSGTDEARRDELQALLDEPSVKAILCGRGGYGVGRIIDELDFTAFKQSPKWLIGFSDITVLHNHIHKVGIASLHAPMAAAFNDNGYKNKYVQSLKDALVGKKANYTCAAHKYNKVGKTTGQLVGGNLSLFTHLIGTDSDIDTTGTILFLEDIGEYLYNVDRMLHQLKRTGKLKNLAGLIIGGFTDNKDTERPFGKKVHDIIRDIIAEYNYPVCYKFPVSHEKENYALKVGVEYALSINNGGVILKEK